MVDKSRFEVKPAEEVIHSQAAFRELIGSSTRLSYATLLIKRRDYARAARVLEHLSTHRNPMVRDLVWYMGIQLAIETGDYAGAKSRVSAKLDASPSDLTALSLLQYALLVELESGGSRPVPAPEPLGQELPESGSPGEDSESPGLDPGTSSMPTDSAHAPHAQQAAHSAVQAGHGMPDAEAMPQPSSAGAPAPRAGDGEQSLHDLAFQENAECLIGWLTGSEAEPVIHARDDRFSRLGEWLPETLPAVFERVCRGLEAGAVRKICVTFENAAVTSWHGAQGNMVLVTGPIDRSLLAIVRAENHFQRLSDAREPTAS